MNGKKERTRRIWQRAWLIALLIAPLWLIGCATGPKPHVGQVIYSGDFMNALALEVEQGRCGDYCVRALADWEAVMIN